MVASRTRKRQKITPRRLLDSDTETDSLNSEERGLLGLPLPEHPPRRTADSKIAQQPQRCAPIFGPRDQDQPELSSDSSPRKA